MVYQSTHLNIIPDLQSNHEFVKKNPKYVHYFYFLAKIFPQLAQYEKASVDKVVSRFWYAREALLHMKKNERNYDLKKVKYLVKKAMKGKNIIVKYVGERVVADLLEFANNADDIDNRIKAFLQYSTDAFVVVHVLRMQNTVIDDNEIESWTESFNTFERATLQYDESYDFEFSLFNYYSGEKKQLRLEVAYVVGLNAVVVVSKGNVDSKSPPYNEEDFKYAMIFEANPYARRLPRIF